MLSRLLTAKYMLRQKTEMFIYGEKCVKRIGVSDELLNEITPFRRLSNKPVSLSEPQYFISNFEKERGNKYLPIKWEDMNDEEKIDYIVHERYSQLVANKIMNKIAPEQVEHSYALNAQGDIVAHDVGNENCVDSYNKWKWIELVFKEDGEEKIRNLKTIHNHPENEDLLNYIKVNEPEKKSLLGFAFSGGDLRNYIECNEIGYVVDVFRHKFKFIPNRIAADNDKIACQVGNFIIKHFKNAEEKLSSLREKINRSAHDIDEYAGVEGYDKKAQCMYEEFLKDKINYFSSPELNLDTQKDLLYAASDYGKFIQLK